MLLFAYCCRTALQKSMQRSRKCCTTPKGRDNYHAPHDWLTDWLNLYPNRSSVQLGPKEKASLGGVGWPKSEIKNCSSAGWRDNGCGFEHGFGHGFGYGYLYFSSSEGSKKKCKPKAAVKMAQNKQRAATHSQKDPNPKNPNKANRMWRTTTNQWWQDEPKDPRPHCPQPGGCTLLGPASGIGLDTGYGHGAAAMPNQRTRRRDASAAPEDGEFWGATECTESKYHMQWQGANSRAIFK